MPITYLNNDHKKRYSALFGLSHCSAGDKERQALFYIIAGNSELYEMRHSIYNFTTDSLKIPKSLGALCSSSQKLYYLGKTLYNGSAKEKSSVHDLFISLDQANRKLAINAIALRFSIPINLA